MASPALSLPLELGEIIATFLLPDDLMCMRQTCQTFNNYSMRTFGRAYFECLSIPLCTSGMYKLFCISSNEVLRSYVKKVILEIWLPDQVLDAYWTQPPRHVKVADLRQFTMEQTAQRLNAVIFIASMAPKLRELGNCTSIIIAASNRDFPPKYLGLSFQHGNAAWDPLVSVPNRPPSTFNIPKALEALSHDRLSKAKISLHLVGTGWRLTENDFGLLPPCNTSALVAAFRHLRHLVFRTRLEYPEGMSSEAEEEKSTFLRFLNCTPNLKLLNILNKKKDIKRRSRESNLEPILRGLNRNASLPQLEVLILHRVAVGAESWQLFLKSRRSTLAVLELCQLYLSAGSPEAVFNTVKHGLSCKHLRMGWVFTENARLFYTFDDEVAGLPRVYNDMVCHGPADTVHGLLCKVTAVLHPPSYVDNFHIFGSTETCDGENLLRLSWEKSFGVYFETVPGHGELDLNPIDS